MARPVPKGRKVTPLRSRRILLGSRKGCTIYGLCPKRLTQIHSKHVINLEPEGGFASDFPNSLYGIPSKVSVIATSPCEIYCVPTAALRSRISTDPEFKFIVAKTTEQIFEQVYSRLIESYTISPRERYQQLVAKYPYLFEIFQLQDIASFLRITPTHLSRIRKETTSDK